MAEQFLTVEQTADRLHVHPITVRRHLRRGTLRGIKRGKLWRIPESALSEGETGTAKQEASPFARALDLVAQLESQMQDAPRRVSGLNDAATELRDLREARIA